MSQGLSITQWAVLRRQNSNTQKAKLSSKQSILKSTLHGGAVTTAPFSFRAPSTEEFSTKREPFALGVGSAGNGWPSPFSENRVGVALDDYPLSFSMKEVVMRGWIIAGCLI